MEIKPTIELLSNPYVLQLIEQLSKNEDRIDRLVCLLAERDIEIGRMEAEIQALEEDLAGEDI